MPRPIPVSLPDLPRRARRLLSLHPELARESWPTDFVPRAVVDWLGRVATLPEGASFAQLVESLRGEAPEQAAALEAEAYRARFMDIAAAKGWAKERCDAEPSVLTCPQGARGWA